ncbi:hypothetical protein A2U01_0119425, partial [Trifolium medium]|nr:hypothetical protein [Trifolium medium]
RKVKRVYAVEHGDIDVHESSVGIKRLPPFIPRHPP